MSLKTLNNFFAALIILLSLVRNIQATTKQLYNIQFASPHMSQRLEVAELHNFGEPNVELVVKGARRVKYPIPGDAKRVYEESTTYNADKNGYYARYIIRIINVTDRLGALTLKTLAG